MSEEILTLTMPETEPQKPKVRLPIIKDVFGPGGVFAQNFKNYEPRPGQMHIAAAIDHAMHEKQHAFIEGPCGVGKSLAYIVPATHHASGDAKKIVIATANIALQEQLINKDLPAMAEILPWKFTYGLLKGLNNYACKAALASQETIRNQKSMFQSPELFQQMSDIYTWAAKTQTGDVSELSFLPDGLVWSRLSVTAEDCAGADCPLKDECFGLKAKQDALKSDVIVTNYHMLFAHLSMVGAWTADDKGILPGFSYLIMDEAHEAPDIARDFFGFQLSQRNVDAIASQAKSLLGMDTVSENMKKDADLFFSALVDYARSPSYKIRLRAPHVVDGSTLLKHLRAVETQAEVNLLAEADPAKKQSLKKLFNRAANAAKGLDETLELADPNAVYWIEQTDKNVFLKSKTIHVGDKLRETIFESQTIKAAIAISATMTTGVNDFNFVRNEFGAGAVNVITAVADSPFNFAQQGLVVVPNSLPSPKDPAFTDAAAEVTNQVVKSCGGRTLALFTSYKNLNAAYERVKFSGFPILKQGTMPRNELIRRFKTDIKSVLLGTDSFWTGVDISGEALTGLVIDRLPFEPPTDPVVDAISSKDPKAFGNYMIPKAVITLRQGIGRAIRTQSDIAVIVILDARMIDTWWGSKAFIPALPKGIKCSRDLNDVPKFLAWANTVVPQPPQS